MDEYMVFGIGMKYAYSVSLVGLFSAMVNLNYELKCSKSLT